MRLTIIVGCHCSSLNSRIGYVYTGPLFSGNYCTTWLSQLYSGRAQPTLLFLLSFLHCWCQGNDNVMTFTWQVSLFWILREKGIDIIEWLYPATFMQCIHNSQGNPVRQCYYPHSWWANTLWKVEQLAKVIQLGRMCSSQDVLAVSCWGLLHPEVEGLGTQEALQLPWYGIWPGTDSTAHLGTSFLPEQACTKTADLFMVLLSHSLLLCFHNLLNSFPPENQSPLNYVPLRWAATNWKCGRWNKGTLVGQTHNTQLPRQWGRSGWGGKPTTGEYICLDIRKEYSLGQHRDLESPLSPPNPTDYSASLTVFRWHTHLCSQWNKCINTTCLTVLNTALNQEAWFYQKGQRTKEWRVE